MKSQRQLQIGETIKRIISDIFLRDDIFLNRQGSHITILQADVSPDVKSAKIFIDIFGNEPVHQNLIEKLNEMAPHFRYQIAKKMTLRVVPEISFVLDKTQKNAFDLAALIDEEARKIQSFGVKAKKPKSVMKKKSDDKKKKK